MLFFIIIAITILPLQNVTDALPKLGGGINFQNILTLILLAGWILSTTTRGEKLIPRNNGLSSWLWTYVILTFLALFYGVLFSPVELPTSPSDPRFVHWKDELTAILMFFMVATAVKNDRSIKLILFFMAVITPYVIWYYVKEYNIVAQRVGLNEFSWELKYISGIFTQLGSNEMAAFYVHSALFFLGIMIYYPNWKWRIYLLINTVLYLYGSILSLSRGAWLATVMGILYLGALKSRKILVIFIIFMIASPVILPAAITSRAGGDESSEERLVLWSYAIKWGIRYPTGIGYQCYRYKNQAEGFGRFLDTHNFYLRAFAELGPFGLFVVLMIFYKAFSLSKDLMKKAKKPLYRAIGLGGALMIIGAFVGNAFGDRLSHLPLGLYIWTAMGLVCKARILNDEVIKEELKGKEERRKILKQLLEFNFPDDYKQIPNHK